MLLQLVLVRDDALGGELLDLRLPVVLPVLDVRRPTDAQRTAGVDHGAHHVAVVRAEDGRFVRRGRAGLLRRDEPRADPDRLCTVHEVGR